MKGVPCEIFSCGFNILINLLACPVQGPRAGNITDLLYGLPGLLA